MSDYHRTAWDRDTRIENFAAELTLAVYPLVLRTGLKDSWIKVELDLWRAVAEVLKKWDRRRPSAASAAELEAWREGFLVDLTESAFDIALNNGIKRSRFDLELGLYRAVRRVTRRYSRVRQSE